MQRKLASIQRIDALTPIDGADRIERAHVLGWTVVVRKGEFQEGDLCVFFEIDSHLPSDAPWTQFMAQHGFRVRTAKLRGCLSQGLALPISILERGIDIPTCVPDHVLIGNDVTSALSVTKYEPPLPIGGDVAGPFPGEVPKTDEMRAQSFPSVIDEIRQDAFYATVKLDGTSATFLRREEGLIVCSRNWALKDGDNAYWSVARRYGLERLPIGMCVQGELCGPGIQKNRLGLGSLELFIFDAFDTLSGTYLRRVELEQLCKRMDLKCVPLAACFDKDEASAFTLDMLLTLAEGTYEGIESPREGIVIRPVEERRSATLGGGRLSFKVISNSFLLAGGD